MHRLCRFSHMHRISTIYTAVPAAMDRIILCFHRCSAATTTQAASAGTNPAALVKRTSFRQYTTSIAITAYGSTAPRYRMYAGVSRPSGNSQNGKKRVSIVASVHRYRDPNL